MRFRRNPESEIHSNLKSALAGAIKGKSEYELPSGRKLDVASKTIAIEIERTRSKERIKYAIKKLAQSKRKRKILIVPDNNIEFTEVIGNKSTTARIERV